jgi:hypothetical protein
MADWYFSHMFKLKLDTMIYVRNAAEPSQGQCVQSSCKDCNSVYMS